MPAVQRRWRTASKAQNKGFEVQQSADGHTFQVLGLVVGADFSATAHAYAHTAVAQATTYYRPRQVDLDGTSTYPPVVIVATYAGTPAAELQLVPNPAQGHVLVVGATEAVRVYDATGRLLREQASSLPLMGLAKGLYLVWSAVHTARLVIE